MSRSLIFAVIAFLAVGCRETAQPEASTATQSAAPAPAPTATTATAAVPLPAPVTHDVTGAYFPTVPWPAEFAELDFLALATIDENAEPAPLSGFLRPKESSAKDYTMLNPELTERNLTFLTAAVDGVQYSFTGTFDVLDNFPASPPAYETVVLTGTLTKRRNGTTVASTPVKFRYEAGG